MKLFKKFAGMLLAMIMVLSMSTVAFATHGTNDNSGSITINNAEKGHTYNAYQVLVLESYNTDVGAYSYKANDKWKNWLESQTKYVSIDAQGYVTWVKDADVAAFAKAALAHAEEANINPVATKTADDATADFVTEEAVFYQNGTWEYNNIADIGDENLGILPIYIGVDGEENQGVCTGTENYWCVNSKASEDDIQATLDFMNWCVTSDEGVEAMCRDMGFVIPFSSNLESENTLVNEANKYMEEGKTPVTWVFSTMPSEEWKNGVGSALTAYAADQTDANWDKVVSAFVDGWAAEAAAAK